MHQRVKFSKLITSSAILYGDGDALISIFIVVHKLPFLLYALTCTYVRMYVCTQKHMIKGAGNFNAVTYIWQSSIFKSGCG